jgi:hypothetical protein
MEVPGPLERSEISGVKVQKLVFFIVTAASISEPTLVDTTATVFSGTIK